MQPLGRKYFLSKNVKHKCKENGKHIEAWWEDVIPPNKARDKEAARKEIKDQSSHSVF